MLIKNKFIKLVSITAVLFLILSLLSINVLASAPEYTEERPFSTYTYWDGLGTAGKSKVYVKPMYRVNRVLNASTLDGVLFGSVDDICTDNGFTYILDGNSSKIYVLNSSYKTSTVINNIVHKGETLNISGASGIFAKNNQIYIADTKNARILIIDMSGNVLHYLTLPQSKLIPKSFKYSPIKVAVDSRDYLYIASDGSFYGALVYSPEMEFLGFYGANTVAVSVGEALKNFIVDLFSTDAKKAGSVRKLPYQFTDFAIGEYDFVYTVTSTSETAVSKGQVKRLNPGGKDVFKKDDFNFADESNRLAKPESLKSIDVDKDGFFYLLDGSTTNRVFWYDKECNLICVFGGGSSTQAQKGTFAMGGSVAINGDDILVSDPVSKNVTVFTITDYGKLVRNADINTLNDNFEETFEDWNTVIKYDVNNQLAYRGLAKTYYSKNDFDNSLKYAKLGADRETYADSFVKIRTAFLEKWFSLVILCIAVLIAGIFFLLRLKKKKNIAIKNEKVKIMLSGVFHPFDSFATVKEKQMGSGYLATLVLALFYAVTAIRDTAMGYAFNRFDPSSYNSFFVLLRTVALVLLFVIANWLVCVLMGGIGKLKEIYIVTCYSLIPTIVATVVSILLSHMLSPDEFVFVTIFEAICIGYTFCILAVGIMKVHDYGFGQFIKTTIITAIAMIIIVFLFFLIFMLAQQVFGWVGTLYTELKYR